MEVEKGTELSLEQSKSGLFIYFDVIVSMSSSPSVFTDA